MPTEALDVVRRCAAAAGVRVAVEAPPLAWVGEGEGGVRTGHQVPLAHWRGTPQGLAAAARAGRGPACPPAVPIPLLGDFQLQNAGVALAVLQVLQSAAAVADAAPTLFTPSPAAGAHDAVAGASAPATEAAVLRQPRVTDAGVLAGFAATRWPGRLERVTLSGSPSLSSSSSPELLHPSAASGGAEEEDPFTILLDGGHNEHALAALREALDTLRTATTLPPSCNDGDGHSNPHLAAAPAALPHPRHRRGLILVYGGTSSRDVTACLRALLSGDEAVFAVPFPTPEGMSWIACHRPADIVAAVGRCFPGGGVTATACGSLQEGVAAARALWARAAAAPRGGGASGCTVGPAADITASLPPLVVVCGSLYLVSEAYRCLLPPSAAPSLLQDGGPSALA
jgi:hypothetical protein